MTILPFLCWPNYSVLFDLGIKGVELADAMLSLSSFSVEISGCVTNLGEEKEGDSGGNGEEFSDCIKPLDLILHEGIQNKLRPMRA